VPFVIEHGLTPIPHLTGKDGNRSFIEARLHHFAHMGAENVLALTGDVQHTGFQGESKPVYDLDSVLIVWLIQAMREGISFQLGKRSVQTTPFDFLPGVVVNPYKVRRSDQMMQLYKLELKLKVGAGFVITQLGYNIRKLYELKQYLKREGLEPVPVLANIYVPTATIAKMMRSGQISGCAVSEELIRRLGGEKKPDRLERAALMVAAARGLGFAGAHVGGFGLKHRDFMQILDRSGEIGDGWEGRMDELVFEEPGEFYLLPPADRGLSDGSAPYNSAGPQRAMSLQQRLSHLVHDHAISADSWVGSFLRTRLEQDGGESSGSGFWRRLLDSSQLYRTAAFGCVSCGDCIQDHLHYAGCTMSGCYKELRNGPCGGSRIDGSCETDQNVECIWNTVFERTIAAGEDPRKYARTLIPPRDWCLDQTNALANRVLGLDSSCRRQELGDER
jgi:methylenetetrahydrofolate reductase (NADPH)